MKKVLRLLFSYFLLSVLVVQVNASVGFACSWTDVAIKYDVDSNKFVSDYVECDFNGGNDTYDFTLGNDRNVEMKWWLDGVSIAPVYDKNDLLLDNHSFNGKNGKFKAQLILNDINTQRNGSLTLKAYKDSDNASKVDYNATWSVLDLNLKLAKVYISKDSYQVIGNALGLVLVNKTTTLYRDGVDVNLASIKTGQEKQGGGILETFSNSEFDFNTTHIQSFDFIKFVYDLKSKDGNHDWNLVVKATINPKLWFDGNILRDYNDRVRVRFNNTTGFVDIKFNDLKQAGIPFDLKVTDGNTLTVNVFQKNKSYFNIDPEIGDGQLQGNSILLWDNGVATSCARLHTDDTGSNCNTEASDDRTYQVDAGSCLTFTWERNTPVGAPAFPDGGEVQDTCDLNVYYEDGTGTQVRSLHSADTCPANATTYSVCGTDTGVSGGNARAGIVWFRIQVKDFEGVADLYNVNNLTGGTAPAGGSVDFAQGYMRSGVIVSDLNRSPYASGKTRYAYPNLYQVTSQHTQRYADTSVENVRMRILRDDSNALTALGAEQEAGGLNVVDGTTDFNWRLDVNYGRGDANFEPVFEVTGNSDIDTGIKWTHIASSGNGAFLTRLGDTNIVNDKNFLADSNLWFSTTGASRDNNISISGSSLFNLGEKVTATFALLNANDENITASTRFQVHNDNVALNQSFVNNCIVASGCDDDNQSIAPSSGLFTLTYTIDKGDKNSFDRTGNPKHLVAQPQVFIAGKADQNSVTINNTHKVSKLYLWGANSSCTDMNTTSTYSVFNLGERVDFNFFLCTVRQTTIPTLTGLDVNVYSDATGLEDNQGGEMLSNSRVVSSYVTVSSDKSTTTALGSPKFIRIMDDNGNLTSQDNNGSNSLSQASWALSSLYYVDVHPEKDSTLTKDSPITSDANEVNNSDNPVIIASDVTFTFAHVQNVRLEDLRDVNVAFKVFRPDGTQKTFSSVIDKNYATDSTGWTSESFQFAPEAPSGDWNYYAYVDWNGNDGNDYDKVAFISPYTGDMELKIQPQTVNGTFSHQFVFGDGMRIKIFTERISTSLALSLRDADNNEVQVTIIDANGRVVKSDLNAIRESLGVYYLDYNVNSVDGNVTDNNIYTIEASTKLDSRNLIRSTYFTVSAKEQAVDPLDLFCTQTNQSDENVYCVAHSQDLNADYLTGKSLSYQVRKPPFTSNFVSGTATEIGLGSYFFGFKPDSNNYFFVDVNLGDNNRWSASTIVYARQYFGKDYDANIGAIQLSLSDVNARLIDLNNRLMDVNSRLSTVTTIVNNIDANVGTLVRDLNCVTGNNQSGGVCWILRDLNTSIRDVNTRLGDVNSLINTRITDLNTRLVSIDSNVQSIKQTVQGIDVNLTFLALDLNCITQTIEDSSACGRVLTIQNDLNSLTATLDNSKGFRVEIQASPTGETKYTVRAIVNVYFDSNSIVPSTLTMKFKTAPDQTLNTFDLNDGLAIGTGSYVYSYTPAVGVADEAIITEVRATYTSDSNNSYTALAHDIVSFRALASHTINIIDYPAQVELDTEPLFRKLPVTVSVKRVSDYQKTMKLRTWIEYDNQVLDETITSVFFDTDSGQSEQKKSVYLFLDAQDIERFKRSDTNVTDSFTVFSELLSVDGAQPASANRQIPYIKGASSTTELSTLGVAGESFPLNNNVTGLVSLAVGSPLPWLGLVFLLLVWGYFSSLKKSSYKSYAQR